uniref:Reverse transcriptase domain-containing protein n=1 Tax=Podarcis muralis TaxID=64176 RepID=A0A670IDE3_PODMU
PKEYYQAKSAYKYAQKKAKQEWQLNRWHALIAASNTRNSRKFWLLVNRKSKRYPLTVIPAPVWESYLRNYFALPDLNINTIDGFYEQLPLWPPTDPEEIHGLISNLKVGKAPGPDLVPAEAIKLHADWWAKILAITFDAVNNSGKVPRIWKDAIIIPIHKKGSTDDPGNYRNISLLSIIGKIYARFLLTKLTKWAEENNLIGPEQAGFRPNQSAVDHVLVLYHLARKYSAPNRGQLCAAFIDLKAAFDSIPRGLLWGKLARWGIDKRLLWLITKLHDGSAARVRITPAGDLSNPVTINRGVRQGCILAPTLFNLFISDMRAPLIDSQETIHAPRLAQYRCPLLLYADDAVILSFSRVGLRRALKIFDAYCKSNFLTINHAKSKVLIFTKSRKTYNWRIDGKAIEQVFKFQYLGVLLQHNMGWKVHLAYVLNRAKALSFALLRFFFSDGAFHIPSVLKVFKAKVIATIAYAIPIWGSFVNLTQLEVIQNQLLRRLLKLPRCVGNTAIRLELNVTSLGTTLWKCILCYWLALWHKLPNLHLIQCLWRDDFPSPWAKIIHGKLVSLGLSPSELLKLDLISAKRIITHKLEEMDLQFNIATGGGTCSPINLGLTPPMKPPSYLT